MKGTKKTDHKEDGLEPGQDCCYRDFCWIEIISGHGLFRSSHE